MYFITMVVIIYFVWRFFRKRKSAQKNAPDTAPLPGSRAEKKAKEEFQRALIYATGEYGDGAIEYGMQALARKYREGDGVEKDLEQHRLWRERTLLAKMQLKTYRCEFHGPGGYYITEKSLDFLIDGTMGPPDFDRALDLGWLFWHTKTHRSHELLKKVMKVKHPELDEAGIDDLVYKFLASRLCRPILSQKAYQNLQTEMTASGICSQQETIEWILKKLEWKVPVSAVSFPGVTPQSEQQFRNARAIEAKGQDYRKAIAAYEPAAAAGHTEAMRRLGVILRDIVSPNVCSKEYAAGQDWLKRAAAAGNALAAVDLGERNLDAAFIAGLAGQGNLDAMYALGCMVENGHAGKASWEMAQCIFRHMEQMLGDPITEGNGEGIEWLRKLGNKFGIIDDDYYVKLADAGSAIGYGPSQTALVYMSHVIMERVLEESDYRPGYYDDFGFASKIIQLAKAPQQAGIAKAAAISNYYMMETDKYWNWRHKKEKDAEKNPKDIPHYQNLVQHYLLAVTTARRTRGMNFHYISDQMRKSDDGMAAMTRQQKSPAEDPELIYRDTEDVSSWDPVAEAEANKSFKNMPSCIYDSSNNRWDKVYAYHNCAVYRNSELGETTITDCDISGRSASGSGGYYQWY